METTGVLSQRTCCRVQTGYSIPTDNSTYPVIFHCNFAYPIGKTPWTKTVSCFLCDVNRLVTNYRFHKIFSQVKLLTVPFFNLSSNSFSMALSILAAFHALASLFFSRFSVFLLIGIIFLLVWSNVHTHKKTKCSLLYIDWHAKACLHGWKNSMKEHLWA